MVSSTPEPTADITQHLAPIMVMAGVISAVLSYCNRPIIGLSPTYLVILQMFMLVALATAADQRSEINPITILA